MRRPRPWPGGAGRHTDRVPRDLDRARPWRLVFGVRHASLATLALAAGLVGDLGPRHYLLAALVAGVALPADVLLHRHVAREARLPRVVPYVDQLAVAGAAVLFPHARIPLLLVALADLGLMTMLAGRRTAAGAAIVGVQGFAVAALGSGTTEALVGALGYVIVAPALVATVGANEDTLRHRALHDATTGVGNRLLLHDSLERATEDPGRRAALLLCGVDGFRDVNETLGYGCGDRLLAAIARRLRATFAGRGTVARFGGDEFAIVLPDIGRTPGPSSLAGETEAVFDEPFELDGVAIRLTACAGGALYPDHGVHPESLLSRAETALARAKDTGPGAFCVFTPGDGEDVSERLALLADLRRGLEDGELVLHYQPKLDLRTGRITGVEALARWAHPTRGLLPPARFVPLAETSGLIGVLTTKVLDAALAQARAWADGGIELDMAVNVSVRDLQQEAFPGTVAELLASHGVPGERLVLELTESGIMDDPEGAAGVLERIADLGVRISVDDFGTGQSSLAYLKRLPIHELKIDRAFISGLMDDGSDAIIVRSLVDLSHKLGLDVVAEGVEDRQALERVVELTRCDLVQGYAITVPLGAEELGTWMATSGWATAASPLGASA